ncbi:hypothetical protein [Acidithiobacillus thiooxidans]|uniref:hypothetical protein n=1 Tax=Acidithiobacillus thiooxidans TaxID=930 RepID=UPI00356A354F
MTAPHKDQLLALGEKLKQDVKAAGKKRSEVFLSIWNGIEQNLLDKDFDSMSARDPKNARRTEPARRLGGYRTLLSVRR